MEDILDHFGVPCYLKIDIEKADRFCMEALDRSDLPEFVSFEESDLNDLFFMEGLGYSRFKMIAQEDFCQIHYDPGWTIEVSQRLEQIRSRVLRKLNVRAPETASREHYAYGSSGPFGESTDGPWRQEMEVAFTWLAFDLGHTGDPDPVRNDWFDVHCAR